jgi:putative flippase GtrA
VGQIRKFWMHRGIRYLIIGGWNTAFGFSVLVFLRFFAIPPLDSVTALTVSTFISVSQAYLTQRKLVWKSSNRIRQEFPKFLLTSVLQFLLNLALIAWIVDRKHLPFLVSQFVISVTLIFLTFLVMRFWIFTTGQEN